MVFKESHNPQVWKFLPARRIKGVYQILQIQEKSGLHTHQFFGTKCLAANIGLAAIAALVVDGIKCFFIILLKGWKEAADNSQLRQARSVVRLPIRIKSILSEHLRI